MPVTKKKAEAKEVEKGTTPVQADLALCNLIQRGKTMEEAKKILAKKDK